MSTIRFSGMASGLPPNIVEQIMEAERIPIKQMTDKKAGDEDKLKLVSDLESKISEIPKSLSELVSVRGFQNNKLTSGAPDIINGVVDPESALPGSWQVEVLQLAQKPGAISNGFPDKDKTEMGVGYIKFKTPDGVKEVYINGEGGGSTLEGVANAINRSNYGLRASVMNDRSDKDNPFRLMISGLATGDDMQIEFPTIYLLDGDQDFHFDKSHPAQNAKIKVDGFEIEVPENTVKDIIPGVNLELKQAAPGKAIAINVKEDYEVISGKIKTFVDAYNGALSWIQGQAKLSKDRSGRERLGPLGGDGMLRTVENALRRTIQSPQMGTGSDVQRANELGIEFNRNGTLNFSQDKFNKALTSNPKGVSAFLRGDNFATGFVPTVRREMMNLTNAAYGPLSTRKRGIEQRIKTADQRIERKENELVKKEESLRRKFSDLETKMSKLQQQGAALGGGAKQQG